MCILCVFYMCAAIGVIINDDDDSCYYALSHTKRASARVGSECRNTEVLRASRPQNSSALAAGTNGTRSMPAKTPSSVA